MIIYRKRYRFTVTTRKW